MSKYEMSEQQKFREYKRIVKKDTTPFELSEGAKNECESLGIDPTKYSHHKGEITPKAKKGSYRAVPYALEMLLEVPLLATYSNTDLLKLLKVKHPKTPIPSGLWSKKLAKYDIEALKKVLKTFELKGSNIKYTESLLRGCKTLSQIKKKILTDYNIREAKHSVNLSIKLSDSSLQVNGNQYQISEREYGGKKRECIRIIDSEGRRQWLRVDLLLALG